MDKAIHQKSGLMSGAWRAIASPAKSHHARDFDGAEAFTPFQAPDWLEGWYSAASQFPHITPCIVSVYAPCGALAMILPLAVTDMAGRKTLSFADGGAADYQAPLLGSAAPTTAADMQAAWRAIRKVLPRVDLIRFEKMPSHIEGRSNPLCLLPNATLSNLTQALVTLSLPYDENRLARMAPKFRETLDGKRARLAKRAEIRFGAVTDRAEIERLFDDMMEQKKRRAADMGWEGYLLGDPIWQNFFRALALGSVNGGCGRVYALWIDGKPEASLMGFQRGNWYCDVLGTFNAGQWSNYSIGLLVREMAMEHMAQQGLTHYDMTIGQETFKRDMGADFRPLHEYVEAATSLGTREAIASRAKGILRRFPTLQKRLKKLLGRN